MPNAISIDQFLDSRSNWVLLDVRSEAEFEHAHIPGAVNIPLLRNEERVIIGTIFKKQGREAAVKMGYELIGPRFLSLFNAYKSAIADKKALFYCWRGGLRSNISATIFEWGGYQTAVLKNGYKAFRKKAIFGCPDIKNLQVLSGFTGVGKTEILHLLQSKSVQIVDLEGLAHHKGSALGALGMPAQNSNEMFENELYYLVSNYNLELPIFTENESRRIGNNIIPLWFWQVMAPQRHIEITVPFDIRLERILKEYGLFNASELAQCCSKVEKRMGGQNLKRALNLLEVGDIQGWAKVMMEYYDKTYNHSSAENKQKTITVDWDWNQMETSLKNLISLA